MQLLLLVLLFLVAAIALLAARLHKNFERSLLEHYQEALRTGDYEDALLAARAYYTFRSARPLSTQDEQRIATDLKKCGLMENGESVRMEKTDQSTELALQAQLLRWRIQDLDQGLDQLQATERLMIRHRFGGLLDEYLEVNGGVRHRRRLLKQTLGKLEVRLKRAGL